MFSKALKKKSLKYPLRFIAYFSLLCLCLTSLPSKLFSDDSCCCVLVTEEDTQRTKTATIVAGATIIGLVAGVAYIAFGAGSHRHHSSSSSSSYCYSDHSPYCSSSSPYSSSSSGSRQSSDSSPWYSDFSPSQYYSSNPNSIFSENNVSSFSGGSDDFSEATDPQILERGDRMGDHPARLRSRKLARSKGSKESSQLSGLLTSHPSLSSSGQGSFTAFVQLPDGTTQVLGRLPFSAHGGTSLSYGPFNQKGTYAFGISLDEGTQLATQTKVASIEIHLNGSTVQNGEFLAPPHAPANYEPTPFYYDYQ